MGDWRNSNIHIDTDGGGAVMDIRYDDDAVDFSINGTNEFTMAKEDVLILLRELSDALREEENKCPYCGHDGHTFEDGDDDGYDEDGNYFDSAWCSCHKCGKYFLKTKTYMPFKIKTEKEEDYEE